MPNRTPQTPQQLAVVRKRLGALLIAMAFLTLPAAAQEPLPRVCDFPLESDAYCALFGLVPSWEDCKCVPAEFDPGSIRDLCDFTPSSAEQICKARGMWFDSYACECAPFRLLPKEILPKIPETWWPEIPKPIVSWRDGALLVHRGDGTFIATATETLSLAIELVASDASLEEIEAQGLTVETVDGP